MESKCERVGDTLDSGTTWLLGWSVGWKWKMNGQEWESKCERVRWVGDTVVGGHVHVGFRFSPAICG